MNERKCMSCGENPAPRETGRFPSAVIEINNPPKISVLRKVVIPASMGDDVAVPASVGKYRNVLLHYDANGHNYLYSSDGIPTLLEADVPQEVWDRIASLEDMDDELQSDIDKVAQDLEDFKNSPDVVDIVSTYAALQAYDTSSLGDNDEIRVLADETHDGASAYYRWDKTNGQWVFIGITGPYYTKSETDTLLDEKQDALTAGTGIDITNNTISVTETGPTVVQTTGTSTTDVMSQRATTAMVYSDTNGTDKNRICIGNSAVSNPPAGTSAVAVGPSSNVTNYYGVAVGPAAKVHSDSGGYGISIGYSADTSGSNSIAIGARDNILGREASASGNRAIAIGRNAKATHESSIALGDSSATSAQGEMNIGSTLNNGYNNSSYRLLTGLYDPQSNHDAATKGYVDGIAQSFSSAAKVLTTDDLNWPEDNPDGVALWKLPYGVYRNDNGLRYYVTTSSSAGLVFNRLFIVLPNISGSGGIILIQPDYVTGGNGGTISGPSMTQIGPNGVATGNSGFMLTTYHIVNNLNSTYANWVLSANQGKVLNDKIGGNLSRLTTTDKTSLIDAINELVTRVAALENS